MREMVVEEEEEEMVVGEGKRETWLMRWLIDHFSLFFILVGMEIDMETGGEMTGER